MLKWLIVLWFIFLVILTLVGMPPDLAIWGALIMACLAVLYGKP